MSRNLLKAGLLVLISLAGCSLVRDQAYNLGYKDRRALDTLKKQPLYSLKTRGVFDQKDHELILFDGDVLTMRYAYMVDGVERNVAEYSVEVIEDTSAMEGIYRLYGNGPLSGQYAGVHLLTNNNGAYAKINFQDAVSGILEGARAQAEWGWVTDPLAFRSFKTFPIGEPVIFLSDPNAAGGIGGTNASTKQQDLRFIKLAHPSLRSHTNVTAYVDKKGTPVNLSDDVYSLVFNEVFPEGIAGGSTPVTNELISYEIHSVRMIAPNTEIYGVKISNVGGGVTSSPVDPAGTTPVVGASGFLAIEFHYDADRSKTASRMVYNADEVTALAESQKIPHFRWESIATADLPTRVIDRFAGEPIVRVSPFTSEEITAGMMVDNMPLAYNAETTREFHFDITNFSVRVLDVVNRATNATTYRFRMIDDTSTNEGVIQLQGTVGSLVGQYFHFRHYYPRGGEINHGTPDGGDATFSPGTDAPGGARPATDTRLIVKVGQGATESAAKTAVNTKDNAEAAKIVYQSKAKAYKPHRLFVNMHKRGGSWVGVQDDGNYNTDAATNWNINAVSRVVQVRISTNTSPKFSTYRFHTVLDISDNRIVAVLSNIPNRTAPGDLRDSFNEPDIVPVFPNADNDAFTPELSPFHAKYVALELGTGVDNTRAKVEYADTISDALKKLDNRTAWNLYESTAVPTPNRVIKTLAGSSPWIRLNADGYFSSTHTEQLKFDSDDMTVVVSWHRSASASSLENNIVAAAKYAIPLPLAADTSLQEGVFEMRGGATSSIQVPNPTGGYYPVPTATVEDEGGVTGKYKYADNTAFNHFYSALVGTLADANKTRAGKGATKDAADAARAALTGWTWHTLANAPLSPSVILHLMRTTADNGNSPFITSGTSFTDAAGALTDFSYKPYETYEYTFANEPSLQVTVRRIQDTTATSAIYTLMVVNNLNDYETVVRLNGSATLGNLAAGRFMRVRIPNNVDTTGAAKVYATNAAIAVFASQADAESYTSPIAQVPVMGAITTGDYATKYNIRIKNNVAFPLDVLPNGRTYQHLIPHKVAGADRYDMHDLFNPKFIDSAYVQFTNLAAAPAPDEYRIKIKDAGSLDYSTYSYEVMRNDTTTVNAVVYLKLIGEGGLYHNKFAGFRFSGLHTATPAKMHAVIGEGTFNSLTTKLVAQFTTENSGADGSANIGWRYRELENLTNKNFDAFKALSKIHRDTIDVLPERVGTVVRVDKNGVYRSQDTDIFKFDFPADTGGEHITNMQVSITIKKTGTESFGRYYFTPLRTTPANPTNGASTTTPPIPQGLIMYGYLISFNYGLDGSTTLAPYNKHFVILRTDKVDPAAPGDGKVLDTIIATNAINLGNPAGTSVSETGATDAFSLYRFWWNNGTTPRGGTPIPSLAFNFRNQLSTDINSRVIDHLSVNRWVILSNIPAASFGAGSARVSYAYDPANTQIWTFDALNKQIIISNRANGAAWTEGRYDIKMQESDSDFDGYLQLSAAAGSADTAYDQKYVFVQVPGATPDTPELAERRTRDARIIMGDSTVVGNSTARIANTLTAVKTARTDMIAEAAAPAFGEWNAASVSYALNNPDAATGISEKAFRVFHRKNRFFYSYENGTAAVDPMAGSSTIGSQWHKDNWLGYMPLIRQRSGADTPVTNMILERKGIGGNYSHTNVMKMMQMDAGRTILQLAGVNAAVANPAVNFSNSFMGVEYGSDLNDRTAKVVYSPTRAGALEALNLRTTYNYFDSEMATNSGTNEQILLEAIVKGRGSEWVQYSNTLNNKPTDSPPGLPGIAAPYDPPMAASANITDSDSYDKVSFDPTVTTNIQVDPTNKVVRELRIISSGGVSTTNIFVYGYTVIESSLIPSFTATPTPRQDNLRYQFVLRLEGFGDYKNYFMAAEIGRYDARTADNISGTSGATSILLQESETYKGRIMFGKDVATAKAALKYLQGSSGMPGAPGIGTWNFISKKILTKPSPLLDNTSTVAGYPGTGTAANRIQGISQRTGDPALIAPELNASFYSRLATATGAQSNVLDVGNHTNLSFWYTNNEPFVTITSIRSNVEARVRYNATVVENYFGSSQAVRRSNDVIIQLDNLGSPLHGQFIGIRRHTRATPKTAFNDVLGDYFTMQISDTRAALDTAMGVAAGAATTTALPITLRFSNDMARIAGSDNADAIPPTDFIHILTNADTGSFASLDSDGIYMSLSNAQWNYNDTTKLMTISYSSASGTYDDPISTTPKAANTSESYRVIPVHTLLSDIGANKGRGMGVALFRSDDTGGAAVGFLHNRYVSILYHGTPAGTAFTNAQLVYLTNTAGLSNTITLLNSNSGNPAAAQYTLLAPYNGLDLTPLTTMDAIRNPDDATMLPGVWSLMMTTTGTSRYQYDPSNTTLFKLDIAKKELLEERIATTLGAGGVYTGTSSRTAVKYRMQLVRNLPAATLAGNVNNKEQITLKLVKGRTVAAGATAISGEPMTAAATSVGDQYMMVRNKKLTSALTSTPTWENISVETIYLVLTNTLTDAQSALNGSGPTTRPDPFGVAAYVTAIDRSALNYWNVFMGRNDWWFMTTARNTFATNTYNPGSGTSPTGNQLALVIDANTGNGGGGHGNGGLVTGVVNANIGFQPVDMVNGTVQSARTYSAGKMLNFWQRLIRQIDADTFIFQLYGGQNMSSPAYTDYTSGGVSYTANHVRSIVSNKYWIIRAGQGTELFRARVTNGNTAAEALQNLGLLTVPNIAADRGINRMVLSNIPKNVDFIGNSEVNPSVTLSDTPNTLPAAQQAALYSNRAPQQLEVDNYTNWAFAPDLNNPAVSITIRSNAGGTIGEQTITYGLTPIYTPEVDEPNRGIFALTGFGPFAGRIFALRMNGASREQIRIVMAPSSLSRGATVNADGTITTNASLKFLIDTMNSTAGDATHAKYTHKASITATTTNWHGASYYNFAKKSTLAVDIGIASYLDNATQRVLFKHNFGVDNNKLSPARWYDPDNTTNYSVDAATVPPSFSIQPAGQSSTTYNITKVTPVTTVSQNIKDDVDPNTGAARTMTGAQVMYGALHIGDGSDFVGIKIVTTNSGTTGNAGIYVVRSTVSVDDANTKARDAGLSTVTAATQPDHSYARDITFTQNALDYLGNTDVGTITLMTDFSTYNELETVEYVFNNVTKTVQIIRISKGVITSSEVYTTIPVLDWTAADPTTTAARKSVYLLKGQGDRKSTFIKILNNAVRVISPSMGGLSLHPKYAFVIEEAQNNSNMLGTKYTTAAANNFLQVYNARIKSTYVPRNEDDLTNFNLNIDDGGSGTTPHTRSVSYRGLKKMAELFDGKYTVLSSSFVSDLSENRSVNEYEFDYPRKLLIHRSRGAAQANTTNVKLYAMMATNRRTFLIPQGGTKVDSPQASDRGNYYLLHLGNLQPTATIDDVRRLNTYEALTNDTTVFLSAADPGVENRHSSWKFVYTGHSTDPDNYLTEGSADWQKVDAVAFNITSASWARCLDARKTAESTDPTLMPRMTATYKVGGVEKLAVVMTNFNKSMTGRGFMPAIPINNLGAYAADSLVIQLTNTGRIMEMWVGRNEKQWKPGALGTGSGTVGIGAVPYQDYWINTVWAAKFGVRMVKYHNDNYAVYRIYGGAVYTTGMTTELSELKANYKPSLSFQPIQPAATGISNYFMAVQVGTALNNHRSKIVFGETIAEAETAMAALPYNNYVAGPAAQSSEIFLEFLRLMAATKTHWYWAPGVIVGEPTDGVAIKLLDNNPASRIAFIGRGNNIDPTGQTALAYTMELVWGLNPDNLKPSRKTTPVNQAGEPATATNTAVTPNIVSFTGMVSRDLDLLRYPYDTAVSDNAAWQIRDWSQDTRKLKSVTMGAHQLGSIYKLTGWGSLNGYFIRILPRAASGHTVIRLSKNIDDLRITTTYPEGGLHKGSEYPLGP